jgi:TonB family protein
VHYQRTFTLISIFLAASFLGSGQEVLSVDQSTLDQHVDHRVAPVYPPIAKAARIQGTVVFEVRIGVTGKIESSRVVSGPAMLQQAAIDCLKQWTFHAFEKDGTAVPARGTVAIIFDLGKDGPTPDEEKIASQYFPLSDQCRKAVSARTDYPTAAAICEQAAKKAEEFPSNGRFIEKRSAFVYAATAQANDKDLKSALKWAANAVEVVRLGHDDDSGSGAAYSTKGTIEGMLGDLKAADLDLSTAEDFGRKGIAWVENEAPSLRQEYVRPLVRDLRFHAQVLQALNRLDDAQKKLDEAAKYN